MSDDTTPGREALLEAMRHEQARIYGQLCKEHKQADGIPAARGDVIDLGEARRRRAS